MAITATFKTKEGTKAWQVSPSYIMDFDGFSTSYELNAESNPAVVDLHVCRFDRGEQPVRAELLAADLQRAGQADPALPALELFPDVDAESADEVRGEGERFLLHASLVGEW